MAFKGYMGSQEKETHVGVWCGQILSKAVSEAKGLGFSTCLYTCSESHDWQGGWKAVGVSAQGVSLCT